jgi:hypothetical protein
MPPVLAQSLFRLETLFPTAGVKTPQKRRIRNGPTTKVVPMKQVIGERGLGKFPSTSTTSVLVRMQAINNRRGNYCGLKLSFVARRFALITMLSDNNKGQLNNHPKIRQL